MNLVGKPAEVHMTVQITRAATGLTETVELVGRTTVEEAQAMNIQEQEPNHGSNSLNS
jgi:hypothetical protein